jgi:hypothetical protein
VSSLRFAVRPSRQNVDVEDTLLLLCYQERLCALYVRFVHCGRVLIAFNLSLPIQAAAAALTWVRKMIRPRSHWFGSLDLSHFM